MTRDDIIRMAEENGIVIVGEAMFRFAALVAAAEREACEETIDRLKHAIREAMYLLDQPEPRSHAAFSELLCALNPKLREIQRRQRNELLCIQKPKYHNQHMGKR